MVIRKVIESRRELLHRLGLPEFEHAAYRVPVDPLLAAAFPPYRSRHDGMPVLALIATRSHLASADVAARTFRLHNPGTSVFLLLVDGHESDRGILPRVAVVLLRDLALPHEGWLSARLDAAELSNALKPVFLTYLSDYASHAIYMDCDIAVFGRFDAMVTALQTASLVLIPHMMELFPKPLEQWRHPNNADIFNSGLINAGCFGIALDSRNAQEFLVFWRDANLLHAWAPEEGRQTDQQFLNWALINCSDVTVLRDKSYNVAYWNLHERGFRQIAPLDEDPRFEVEGKPLVFFHFSGFDPSDTLRLSLHDQRYSVYTLPSIALILEWYGRELLASPMLELGHAPYRFDTMANGIQLSRFLRDVLKRYDGYFPRFDIMAEGGANGLCSFLMAPLPATGSRLPLLAAVIYESRPDLQEGYPGAHVDLDPATFCRWFYQHAGAEYDIEPLVARFRRTLESDSLAGFVTEIERKLLDVARPMLILGTGRLQAATELRILGRPDAAQVLLSGETEWFFFSDFSAILAVYARRTDLQEGFPEPLGRNHGEFLAWLRLHGTAEHGLSAAMVQAFADKSASQVLARLFSILSRREDLGNLAIQELLLDHPERLIRALIRDAGEGLEYDLADIEAVCFLHRENRALLVPLYLELPAIRRRALSSRTAAGRRAALPVAHDLDWVMAGCRLHDAAFSAAETALEHEIRSLHQKMSATGQDVISVLHASRLEVGAGHLTRLAEKQAIRAMRAANQDVSAISYGQGQLPGVNLFGYFHASTGVGESSRGLERALSLVTRVRQVQQFTSHLDTATRIEALYTRYDHHADCNIFVSYPHAHEDLLGLLPPEMTERRRNIIHLAWEQRDWNTHWRAIYRRYDEIWSISEFAAVPFREMLGADKVRVVPNVLLVDDFPSTEAVTTARLAKPVFRFLFVFDANSSIERKNPEALLHACTAAFSGTKQARDVELVLKVNNLDRAEHGARVAGLRRLAAASGISVIFDGRQLPRDELLLLIASADCYVSLHRAEGFGYTMAEAMYLGVPVIASGYSGNLEYMDSENSYLVPCREVLVQNADGPFQRGSIWGEPDVAVAADMMRWVVANPDEARQVGEKAAAAVRRRLLPAVIAEGLRPALQERSAGLSKAMR